MKLQESCTNSILLCKIINFVTSWNFACMVELEKYIYSEKNKEIYKKVRGFLRSIYKDYLLLLFFSCIHGVICRSHIEIEFGKNFEVIH